jgi:hypothetical protein
MRMIGDLEVSLEVRHPCHMRTMHLTYCAFSLVAVQRNHQVKRTRTFFLTMPRFSSMKEKDVYVPSFLSHHGVATWAVLPFRVGAELPFNFDLVQVAPG